jgi:hypothetical protein
MTGDAIRDRQCGDHLRQAMAAGIADHQWSVRELLEAA